MGDCGESAGLEACVLAPGPACVGRHFLREAYNYRMAYFSTAMLALIASLELVLQARHNMRGQTLRQLCSHPPASVGPALGAPATLWPLPPTPGEEQSAGSRKLEAGVKQLLGKGTRRLREAMPGRRQQMQGGHRAGGGQFLSIHGPKARPEEGHRPSSPSAPLAFLCLHEPGTHSRGSSVPGDPAAP